jgi:hypothetical protein
MSKTRTIIPNKKRKTEGLVSMDAQIISLGIRIETEDDSDQQNSLIKVMFKHYPGIQANVRIILTKNLLLQEYYPKKVTGNAFSELSSGHEKPCLNSLLLPTDVYCRPVPLFMRKYQQP